MVASLCEKSHRGAFVFYGPIVSRSTPVSREGNPMKKILTTLAALLLIAAPLAVQATRGGDDRDKDEKSSIWMKQKLSASQNILAGLTKGDFDAIDKNAQSMLVVEYLEKWLRADTPGYNMKPKDFEYANKALRLAAREKNMDGATIAYIQLTLSCVHCHKLVRDTGK
jgi:cytochrome c556